MKKNIGAEGVEYILKFKEAAFRFGFAVFAKG